jgi:hypothetical protein
MINRLPTWHIWKLLHTYPTREINLLLRVLRVGSPKVTRAPLHNVWVWVILNIIVSALLCFNVPREIGSTLWVNSPILALFITFDSLSFALKANTTLSKWREQGNYDVFMLLPAGMLASLLNICRAYRFPLEGTIHGVKTLLFITLFVVGYILALAASPGNFEVLWLTLFILLTGLFRCIDYMQSFVTATLLVLLANQRQDRYDTQVLVIGGFLGLQIILYVVLIPLLSNTPLLWVRGPISFSGGSNVLYLFWMAIFAPLIFVLCRELINFALWQAVKRRLEA